MIKDESPQTQTILDLDTRYKSIQGRIADAVTEVEKAQQNLQALQQEEELIEEARAALEKLYFPMKSRSKS